MRSNPNGRIVLSFKVLPHLREGLVAAADASARSMQGIVEEALTDWLAKRGHLPPQRPILPRAKYKPRQPKATPTRGGSMEGASMT